MSKTKKALIITGAVLGVLALIAGIVAGCCALFALAVEDDFTFIEYDGSKGGDRIHFLNVGSSDAILLESEGKFALVDCGEDSDNPRGFKGLELTGYEDFVVDYLNEFCADEDGQIYLDFIIGTHAHSDHLGGFDTVLSQENVHLERAYLKRYYEDRIKDSEVEYWDNKEVYEQTVAAQDDALLAEEWAKAEEYNENLAGDPVHDPFVPGSGYALPDNYLDVLNIDGVMGRITIPKIGVDLPIYHGTDAETLEKGVGHIESTSLPIGGEYRHAVLTGHRGLPSAELFTRLDELEPGDQFYLHVLDATLAYQVDQILTVEPQELETLVAEPGQDYVTLVTCTPYGINTHRMLVRGARIPYVPEAEQSTQATAAHLLGGETTTRYFLIGILFGIGLLYLFIAVLLGYRLLHSTAKGENHHA